MLYLSETVIQQDVQRRLASSCDLLVRYQKVVVVSCSSLRALASGLTLVVVLPMPIVLAELVVVSNTPQSYGPLSCQPANTLG